MPILVLLRHGKSDWSGGEPDLHRPLAARGRRQAPEAGRWLARNVAPLDLAVVSPAVRARSTWDLAAAELAEPPPTRVEDAVYAASPGALLRLVRALPDDRGTVVLVGHNPGMEDLVERLTGRWLPIRTSELVVIELAGPWPAAGDVEGTVTAAGRPPAG